MMKVNELIKQVAFSHRPQDGISVGIAVIDNVAYLSAAFVRTGQDNFSRKFARNIITQRILSTVGGKTPEFVTSKPLSNVKDVREIIRNFRGKFKPNYDCNDCLFGLERDQSWSLINTFFEACV